jgi:hypothetical protein
MAALTIRGAVWNCGPLLRFSPLLMATILCSRPDHYCAHPDASGNHPFGVIGRYHVPCIMRAR